MSISFQYCTRVQNWRVLILLAIAVLSVGDQMIGADAAPATLEDYLKRIGYEPIPFEQTDHAQHFVEGVLDGHRKHRFLVDTGWGMTALSKSAAKGLKSYDAKRPKQQAGIGADTEMVLMEKLTLNKVQLFNQPARVEDLRADYIRLPFDAVLGCDFLFRNFCLIDCYKRRLYVSRTKPSTEQIKALDETLRLSGFADIPVDSRFLLTVQADINGQPVRLGLDTGAAFDELDDSQLASLGLTILRSEQASTGSHIPDEIGGSVIGVGSIGGHKVKATHPTNFRLGQRHWNNLYFGVTDLKAWGLAKAGTEGEAVKGLLCQSTLEMHGALIDVAQLKLWLRPEKPTR